MSVQSALAKALPFNVPKPLLAWGLPLIGTLLVWLVFPIGIKVLYLVALYKVVRAVEKLVRDLIAEGFKLDFRPAGLRETLFTLAPTLGLGLFGIFLLGYAIWWSNGNILHIPLGFLAFTLIAG